VPLISAGAAIAAAVFAALTAKRATRTLRLAEQQEERRRPKVELYLVKSYMKRDETGRFYAFLISLRNPSDAENTVLDVVLRITYRSPAHWLAAVDVPLLVRDDKSQIGLQDALTAPVSIGKHGSVSGWAYFRVENSMLNDRPIDVHTIVASDVHGLCCSVDHVLIKEVFNEKETTKADDNPAEA
jgi:hypothetical protein